MDRASRAAPRLLVTEDVHWANRLALAHLTKLATAWRSCPALLVMTSRIEADPLDAEWRSSVVAGAPFMNIDLGPLEREEAMALVVETSQIGWLRRSCGGLGASDRQANIFVHKR